MMKKAVLLILASILATACTSRYSSNGENQYMHSKNGPNLVVPKPLTSETISHFYDLPNQNQTATVSIMPPTEPA